MTRLGRVIALTASLAALSAGCGDDGGTGSRISNVSNPDNVAGIATLAPPNPTAGPTATPEPMAMIQIGSAFGDPGEIVTVDVTLHLRRVVEIAGTQNDIAFPPLASVASTANGRPACVPNPVIHQTATVFGYQPPSCAPEEGCAGVRAIVFSFAGPTVIPDGAVLYSCPFAIDAEATPGSVLPLRCSSAANTLLGSDPDGVRIAIGCEAGEIRVSGG